MPGTCVYVLVDVWPRVGVTLYMSVCMNVNMYI